MVAECRVPSSSGTTSDTVLAERTTVDNGSTASKVWWCSAMKAAKYQNTQLELDCLWNVIFSSVDLCYISNYINWMSFTV